MFRATVVLPIASLLTAALLARILEKIRGRPIVWDSSYTDQ